MEASRKVAVYDIVNCGPRNRFMANGKLVHNSGGYNVQNMKRGGTLRQAIHAPDGYVLLVADLSGIELRTARGLANDVQAIDMFRKDEDLYCLTAGRVYGNPVYKEGHEFFQPYMAEQRQVGKVCIAEGQPVLTKRGYVAIQEVRHDDLLWDGYTFVTHEGVVCNGERDVIEYDGVTGTEDHIVFLTGGGTCPLGDAARNGLRLRRVANEARAVGAACRSEDAAPQERGLSVHGVHGVLQCGSAQPDIGEDPVLPLVRAPEAGSTVADEARERHDAALHQPEEQGVQKLRGEGHRVSVPRRAALRGLDTGEHWAAPGYGAGPGGQRGPLRGGKPEVAHARGEQQEQAHEPGACAHAVVSLLAGHDHADAAAGAYAGADHGLRTEGSDPEAEGVAHYRGKVKVYDILNSGPRHRYTVNGRLVHNCDLSLQYGAGKSSFQGMLRVLAGLRWGEEHCAATVDAWRAVNNPTTSRWRAADAAIRAMAMGNAPMNWNIDTAGGKPVFWFEEKAILLPRGLRIKYPNLHQREVTDKEKSKWLKTEYVYTDKRSSEGLATIYGGKVFENCIAAGTEVLTDKGWVRIEQVNISHLLWDGEEWVRHDGLVAKGSQPTMEAFGVRMTPDHEVLTVGGWTCASSCEGLDRAEVRLPDGYAPCGFGRQANNVDLGVRLREHSAALRVRPREVRSERTQAVLWLRAAEDQRNSWDEPTPCLRGVSVDVRPLPVGITSRVGELWRAGYRRVSLMAAGVRSVLGGHGADIQGGADARPHKQRGLVLPGKLPVGDVRSAVAKPQGAAAIRHEARGGSIWDEQGHGIEPLEPRPVFDLLNAGPRSRFVVRGSEGPVIVHNCCQAIATAIYLEMVINVNRITPVLLSVHDEIVLMIPADQAEQYRSIVKLIMSKSPLWWPDLPLKVSIGIAKSYGDAK